ncbi:MAG TPA: ATP-binding protein [Rectinemataceae bacterium]|nr:ATP-binding protein [Rectinemataceae bacterium]
MRLRSRLSVFFVVVVFVAAGSTLLLVGFSAQSVFRSFVFSGDAQKAATYATILADYYAEKQSWNGVQSFLSEIPWLVFLRIDERIHGDRGEPPLSAKPAEAVGSLMADRIVVADSSGLIVADTSGKLLGTIHPRRHLAHGVPILSGFERVGTVLVGSMIDSGLSDLGSRFLESFSASLLWATLLSALIAILLGLAFSARLTRPLASLNAAVRKVASGDLSVRVAPAGRDELSELSASFNAMTDELVALEEAKKRIIADSAHELRTPVTLIRGTIEAMIDGVYPLDATTLASVHEEVLRLSRLIDTLRELEIIESGRLELSLESVDALELARKAASRFAGAVGDKKIELTTECLGAEPFFVLADTLRLGEVFYNLLTNAIKHSPEGGTVRIRVSRRNADGAVLVAVDDQGPGVPEWERTRIFERFYRSDPSRASDRGGRGLGLAIASEIVKAHGGGIAVADSDLGGASFVLSLPALDSDPNQRAPAPERDR